MALRAWHDDPVLFVRHHFDADPDEWQLDALQAVVDNPRVAMSACKGPGKSCVLAWIVWWFLLTRQDAQVMCLSITKPNLTDNLWKELAKWQAKSPVLMAAFDHQASRIVRRGCEKTWWVSSRAFGKDADPEAQASTLAGFHGEHIMVILDEVGDYPHGVVAAAEAIFANMDLAEVKLVVAGNPTDADGPLGHIVQRHAARWVVVFITGDPDDPKRSPRISAKWAEDMIRDYGRDNPWVQVNVLGIFPSQPVDKLISMEDVNKAFFRDARLEDFSSDARIWGVDPGRFGDDEQIVARRQGVVAFQIKVFRNLNGPQLASQIAMMLVDYERANKLPDMIFVDVGGVGASCFDQLTLLQWGRLVQPVDFAEAPDDSRFYNRRAEIWWRMAEWLRKRPANLPRDNVLAGELTAPKFYFRAVNKQTKFLLESKDDMKARGVPSPNRGDALALTFTGKVAPRAHAVDVLLAGAGRVRTEYPRFGDTDHQAGVITHYDPLSRV
jgi:hypothetical protein